MALDRMARPWQARRAEMPDKLSQDERQAFKLEMDRLLQEHRDLDAAIRALQIVGPVDQLQVQRLKKRKLVLRDRISFLEDQLTPDIIA
jgi:hypothetical protein